MTSVTDSNRTVMARLIAFETAIANSKFSIKGINDEKDLIVIEDTGKEEGIYGKYTEIPVMEVVGKPIDQLIDVLNLERKDVCLEGVTRIVGYYSRVSNWNKSKVGELRDRIVSRKEGGYGFNGSEVNMKEYSDALATVNSL